MHFIFLFMALSSSAFAQNATVALPDTFCNINQFSEKMNKAPSAKFKVCDALKDKSDAKVASFEACKQRALAKGAECFKLLKGVDSLAVRGKFTEKFNVSQNSTTFTCEVDSSGTSFCP